MEFLETLSLENMDQTPSKEIQSTAIQALEQGKVLFFPNLSFPLEPSERCFLSPTKVDPKSKNISYDIRNHKLGGTLCQGEEAEALKAMMHRYATKSRQLVDQLFPSYNSHIIQARTSYRPVEASGRPQSYRKDDTRLHVDAFPANPTKGQRIMRVFTNVNPEGKPRVWRLGEPFSDVVDQMAPRVRPPFPGLFFLLKALRITKGYRTLYDHYMLKIHDLMKGDMNYQKNAKQIEVKFPSGATWIVFSDQVSHAAMSGQYLFEQTFHLPVEGMRDPSTSPLKVLERHFLK